MHYGKCECGMAANCTYNLPTYYHLLAAQQEPYKKAHLLSKNVVELSVKIVRRMVLQQKYDKTERTRRPGKKKKGEEKAESIDSLEIAPVAKIR